MVDIISTIHTSVRIGQDANGTAVILKGSPDGNGVITRGVDKAVFDAWMKAQQGEPMTAHVRVVDPLKPVAPASVAPAKAPASPAQATKA